MENYQGNKTVNQRVASSSLAGGAEEGKAAEMSPFSLIGNGFDGCNYWRLSFSNPLCND